MRKSLIGVLAYATLSASAAAAPFVFELTGSLRETDRLTATGSDTNLIGADRSYRFVASFDTSSPNLVGFFPFPGFVAYAPTSASISIGGTTYGLTSYSPATPQGVAVALFDPRQPFFPGLYGAGFFADPVADGAGIVGDFTGTSTGLLVDQLASTTFTGYQGSGYNQGPGCSPVDPAPCVPTPLSLSAGGQSYALLFGPSGDVVGGPLATASLSKVPTPASWALLAVGAAFAAGVPRRRRA